METRTQKVAKNTIISFFSFVILAITNLITRKIFLNTFSLDLLGYEGMFTSIFTLISIAEIGSGSVFTYLLYKPVSTNDDKEASILLSLLRKMYIFVAFFILLISLIVCFCIKSTFSQNEYAFFIFVSQMLSTFFNYFVSYRIVLYEVMQKKYISTRITTLFSVASSFIKLLIILLTKNYYLYLLIPLLFSFLSLCIVNIYGSHLFNNIKIVKTNYNDFKKRNIISKLKDSLFYRISSVIYSSADGLLIPTICGVISNALYMNYIMFTKIAESILALFTSSMTNAIGNTIWQENRETNEALYYGYDFFSFLIATICFVGFGNDLNTFVGFCFGEKYLLNPIISFILALNIYITCKSFCYCSFQTCIGKYDQLRIYTFLGALCNVLLSIVLGKLFGIAGILIATIVGNIFIQLGRERITTEYFKFENKKSIFIKEIKYFLLSSLCFLICFMITRNFDCSLLSFIIKFILSIIISVLFIFIFYRRTKFYECMINMIKPLLVKKPLKDKE